MVGESIRLGRIGELWFLSLSVGLALHDHQRNANRLGLTRGAGVALGCLSGPSGLLGRSGGVVRVVVECDAELDLDVPAGHADIFDEEPE